MVGASRSAAYNKRRVSEILMISNQRDAKLIQHIL